MTTPRKRPAKKPAADLLLAALRRQHDGDPWHGPSRGAVLADVDATEAAWHPGGGAHSIWETVLHMRSWTREVTRRALGGEPATPEDGDWPAITDFSQDAWAETLASLDAAHEELLATVRSIPETQLARKVGATRDAPLGTGISHRAMILSLADHDVYHTGQLSLLKRLARAARR